MRPLEAGNNLEKIIDPILLANCLIIFALWSQMNKSLWSFTVKWLCHVTWIMVKFQNLKIVEPKARRSETSRFVSEIEIFHNRIFSNKGSLFQDRIPSQWSYMQDQIIYQIVSSWSIKRSFSLPNDSSRDLTVILWPSVVFLQVNDWVYLIWKDVRCASLCGVECVFKRRENRKQWRSCLKG